MTTDTIQPEIQTRMLESLSHIPNQQVNRTTRQKELVGIVIKCLSGEIPNRKPQFHAIVLFRGPAIDVYSICDGFFGYLRSTEIFAGQSSHETVNDIL